MGGRSQSMRLFKEKRELGGRFLNGNEGKMITASSGGDGLRIVTKSILTDLKVRPESCEERVPGTRRLSTLLQDEPGVEKAEALKACMCCGTTKTAQWRTGPLGRKTLCNACGVRFSRSRDGKGKKRMRGKKRGFAHACTWADPSREQGFDTDEFPKDHNAPSKKRDLHPLEVNHADGILEESPVRLIPQTPHVTDEVCHNQNHDDTLEDSSEEASSEHTAGKDVLESTPPPCDFAGPNSDGVQSNPPTGNSAQVFISLTNQGRQDGQVMNWNGSLNEDLLKQKAHSVIESRNLDTYPQVGQTICHNGNQDNSIQTSNSLKYCQPGKPKRVANEHHLVPNMAGNQSTDQETAARERYFSFLNMLRQDRNAELKSKVVDGTPMACRTSASHPLSVSSSHKKRTVPCPGSPTPWVTKPAMHRHADPSPGPQMKQRVETPVMPNEVPEDPMVKDGVRGTNGIIPGVVKATVDTADIQASLARINELQHRVHGAEACVSAMQKMLKVAKIDVLYAHEDLECAKQDLQILVGGIDSTTVTDTAFTNISGILN